MIRFVDPTNEEDPTLAVFARVNGLGVTIAAIDIETKKHIELATLESDGSLTTYRLDKELAEAMGIALDGSGCLLVVPAVRGRIERPRFIDPPPNNQERTKP